jgi:hypothetical protein
MNKRQSNVSKLRKKTKKWLNHVHKMYECCSHDLTHSLEKNQIYVKCALKINYGIKGKIVHIDG